MFWPLYFYKNTEQYVCGYFFFSDEENQRNYLVFRWCRSLHTLTLKSTCLCSPSCAKAGHFCLAHCCIFTTLHNHQPIGAKTLIAENKLVPAVPVAHQDVAVDTTDIQSEGKGLRSNPYSVLTSCNGKITDRKGQREEEG